MKTFFRITRHCLAIVSRNALASGFERASGQKPWASARRLIETLRDSIYETAPSTTRKRVYGMRLRFTCLRCVLVWLVLGLASQANGTDRNAIAGRIVDESGKGVAGVMVSAIDDEHRKWISVFTGHDGTFSINGLRNVNHHVRTRLMGIADEWRSDVAPGTEDLTINTRPAEGEELELQRPASSAFSMLEFDDPRDRMNFKMMCSYCHQIGSLGFRTPEEPVDWETMIRRMDGFGGLYPHTQNTIVQRLMETYKDDAVKKWPAFQPPPPPTGAAAAATITMWELDEPLKGSFHDLEIGPDGNVYAVNISSIDCLSSIQEPERSEHSNTRVARTVRIRSKLPTTKACGPPCARPARWCVTTLRHEIRNLQQRRGAQAARRLSTHTANQPGRSRRPDLVHRRRFEFLLLDPPGNT